MTLPYYEWYEPLQAMEQMHYGVFELGRLHFKPKQICFATLFFLSDSGKLYFSVTDR